MTFGVSAGVLVGVASAGASLYSANAQKKAAQGASNAQAASAAAGISEQQRQFDSIQELLKPYVTSGEKSLTAQQDLSGLNGIDAQRVAIEALQGSPAYTSAMQAGNNSILQNASATGGLRGGNAQAALGQFAPQLLASTINDQYARLGGLSSMGLGAATQTGNFGQAASSNVANLLQQQGASTAGMYLANGKANAQVANSLSNAIGSYAGYGGRF